MESINVFSSKGFLELIGELAGKLGLFLERKKIKKMVITAAIGRKNALKEELSGKFVFLKMDGCTRHRISYLAVNVQFINSKNMQDVKTLAVRDTQPQHSGEFLRHTLETVLKECDLKIQVLATITDNAVNMASQWKNSTK